jgi:ubiquinone biosynthesis protein COQ9
MSPNPQDAAQPDWAEAAEERVLLAALGLAGDLGWNSNLVARAARAAGLSPGDAELLLPNGARDLAALASRRHLRIAMAELSRLDPATLKIRERIRRGVEAKMEATAADGRASRRLAGFLALPTNLPLGTRLLWEAADAIWRWAGDTATDENHYTKRLILSGVLASTVAVRLTSGREAAQAELASRIDNVMAFEKWKAGLPRLGLGDQLAAALARMRYGRSG